MEWYKLVFIETWGGDTIQAVSIVTSPSVFCPSVTATGAGTLNTQGVASSLSSCPQQQMPHREGLYRCTAITKWDLLTFLKVTLTFPLARLPPASLQGWLPCQLLHSPAMCRAQWSLTGDHFITPAVTSSLGQANLDHNSSLGILYVSIIERHLLYKTGLVLVLLPHHPQPLISQTL